MLLFKSVALIQLFYLVFVSIRDSNPVGATLENILHELDTLSMCMIIVGYGISIKATSALGLERTYFGSELGHCEPKWVTEFPYG